tara:strand:+ start:65 stop:283 length:219 start_codon:yes stop_codon:yes gene_type:complete
MIYFEPRSIYDSAIVCYTGNKIIYSYYLLIFALIESNWTEENSIEWVNYNIIGTSMKGWPKILYIESHGEYI